MGVTEFLNWAVALMATFFEWLGDMQLVDGISLLAVFAGVFALGAVIRFYLYKG